MRKLVFICALKFLFCFAENSDDNTLTLFKRGTSDLPGPTMSFKTTLNKGVFQFEFKTFVEKALLLYQDDGGQTDFIRFGFVDVTLYVEINCFLQ